VTRGQVLLLGLGLLVLGAGGYGLFQATGFEGFSAGIAASVLLLLVVVGWTGTYLVRVVSGRMTFSEQRRRYRAGYDAATDAALEARFAALPADEQARLLAELNLEAAPSAPNTAADGPGSATP
jgi:predicted lipid-binding transport protein (Tim44 family)